MAWLRPRRYRRLDVQLALILVAVAVGAVVATTAIAAVTIVADADQILARQEAAETRAAALGAAATYQRADWAQALAPVIAMAGRSGEAAQVRNQAGQVVRSTRGFAAVPPGPAMTAPVLVRNRLVGTVTVKFGDRGIGKIVAHFEGQRWRMRLIAAGVGAFFAIAVALLAAPLIAGPVDRLINTARARASGQLQTRVGKIRGLRDLHELALTFDQMTDAVDEQDQMRRNLVADLAHELRTPIAVLQASTEAMLDHVVEVTPGQVESLHRDAVELGQLADRLQRLAYADAAATQLTLSQEDLAVVAATAADALDNVFRVARVHLVRRLDSVLVHCDQSRMREIVTNLLTNAAKFTPAGGQVLLETGPSGDEAMLRVSDTGIGIPPEELPLIVNRFYRSPGTSGVSGSGLGLTIVDELVSAHHGTMTVASEQGRGTWVTVRVPWQPE